MYRLVIGNRNYSSWSLRGWLAVRASKAAFETELLRFHTPEWDDRIADLSPSGLVPVLHHDDIVVWDTIAIIEYLAERHPEIGFWPDDPAARAHARSSAAEMHSGFQPLRQACPMNMRRPIADLEVSEAVVANVSRIRALWAEARARFGESGPYLYGAWSAADMMYAPVVSRFRTYRLMADGIALSYMEAVEAHPHFAEWREAALEEVWRVEEDEID